MAERRSSAPNGSVRRTRARWWLALLATAATVAATVGVPAQAASASPQAVGKQAGPLVAPNASAASTVARSSGERVEVASATSELTRVFAKPEGGFEFESAVVPQRARRADGSWADINLVLSRGGDGSWRPGASIADVRFSDGGSGPFVTLVRDGKSFSLSWPGGLPTPTVSGESATYAEVLPGVDLVARATRTGFTHVIVLKTAAAAANPAVRRIQFETSGDVRVVSLPGGGLRAEADGLVVASAERPSMWDSAPLSDATRSAMVAGGGLLESKGESTPAGPGDAAVTAPVRSEVTGDGDLLLHPDAELLDSDTAVFPMYVDPPWSTAKSRWSYATSDNRNNEDLSVARVGKNPERGEIYRSFFDFPLGVLAGKHIEDAYVQAKLDHSWNCKNWNNWLYHSNGMGAPPRTTWSPKLNSRIGATNANAYAKGGCRPADGTPVNFDTPEILNLIQTHATNKWTNVTMALCACSATDGTDESTVERWKKFFPDSMKLVVDFDSKPLPPTSLQVSGVACGSGPITIGTLTPTLSAVFPDPDTEQALTTQFEWLEIPASGTYGDTTPRKPAPPGMSVPANGRATTAALSGVQAGKSYAFRARGTDPAPYSLTSDPSSWCEFKPDTTVPQVSVAVTSPPTGPGQPVTFTITSTKTTVTKFRYGWGGPTTEVAASGTTTKSATATLTAPKYGENIFRVSAVDSTLNEGYASVQFTVPGPTPPVARWGLESYPGATQAQALADQRPGAGATPDTPLVPDGIGWKDDARLVGGETASFSGVPAGAKTGGPVVDTSRSFSVSVWVRPGPCVASSGTALSAEGVHGSVFMLDRMCSNNTWRFVTHASDEWNAPGTAVWAPSTVVEGRWQHLAAVFDSTEKQLRLYQDGTLVANTQVSSVFRANGPFVVGAAKWNDTATQYFSGEIADAQVFDRVLVDHDFTGQLATDPFSGGVDEPGFLNPIQVGTWNFTSITPCDEEVIDDPYFCTARDHSPFGRRLGTTPGTTSGAGHQGDGLLLDTMYTDDPSDPNYGKTSPYEYGRSQKNVGVDGNPIWQDTPVLRTDDSFSVSVWARLDDQVNHHTVVAQPGSHESAFWLKYEPASGKWQFLLSDEDNPSALQLGVESAAPPAAGAWTHLVAVYDAGRSEVRLYVNGQRSNSAHLSYVPMLSTNPLIVGRTLWRGQLIDQWIGGVDDLSLYQGALNDVAVKQLFESQPAGL
ncbi:LamG domain-containing protein [Micromonospora sp. NPDC050417]|uniref:LamG domain-containing protein n=1 Tax=Micromonospora sp. NPDC050417 TaxID=3364280 RepID=UPI0037AC38F5